MAERSERTEDAESPTAMRGRQLLGDDHEGEGHGGEGDQLLQGGQRRHEDQGGGESKATLEARGILYAPDFVVNAGGISAIKISNTSGGIEVDWS